jgi:hypothetical protein
VAVELLSSPQVSPKQPKPRKRHTEKLAAEGLGASIKGEKFDAIRTISDPI